MNTVLQSLNSSSEKLELLFLEVSVVSSPLMIIDVVVLPLNVNLYMKIENNPVNSEHVYCIQYLT